MCGLHLILLAESLKTILAKASVGRHRGWSINGLHVCGPADSHVEALTPDGMVFGDGAFGWQLDHENTNPSWWG